MFCKHKRRVSTRSLQFFCVKLNGIFLFIYLTLFPIVYKPDVLIFSVFANQRDDSYTYKYMLVIQYWKEWLCKLETAGNSKSTFVILFVVLIILLLETLFMYPRSFISIHTLLDHPEGSSADLAFIIFSLLYIVSFS